MAQARRSQASDLKSLWMTTTFNVFDHVSDKCCFPVSNVGILIIYPSGNLFEPALAF